jgi:molybdopterin converting factor subunit 1
MIDRKAPGAVDLDRDPSDLLAMSGSILLFGRLRDAFGTDRIELPSEVSTAAQLRARLIQLYPDIASLLTSRAVRFAINQELVADEAASPIGPADEIALLPPLSGG